jgi:prepilin-type processing-associated H-X9-DG protein
VDQTLSGAPNAFSLTDIQAPFCAFAANEAIMPRNKFDAAAVQGDTTIPPGALRHNVFVKRTTIGHEGSTILATEFNSNWKTIALDQGNGFKAVGHRSIMPFYLAGSPSEFNVDPSAFYTNVTVGALYSTATLNSMTQSDLPLIADKTQLNAVGRNHPGGAQGISGTTNFIYLDGHVERKSIVETLTNKEWGSKFYTMTGDNSIR